MWHESWNRNQKLCLCLVAVEWTGYGFWSTYSVCGLRRCASCWKRGCTLSVKQALDGVFAQTALLNPPMHFVYLLTLFPSFHRRRLKQRHGRYCRAADSLRKLQRKRGIIKNKDRALKKKKKESETKRNVVSIYSSFSQLSCVIHFWCDGLDSGSKGKI